MEVAGNYVDTRGFIEVFMPLFLAHLVGDFLLQTERMSLQKAHRLAWLSLHATIVGSITWVLCWRKDAWPVAIVVFLTHLLFDAWKARLPGSPLRWYLWDQICHMAVLLFCAYCMIHYFSISHMPLADWLPLNIQVVIAAYLLTFRPITFGMGLFLRPWRDEVAKINGNGGDSTPLTGLSRSGEWIGNLERCIVLSCILADQFMLVAALLIAKAILRMGDSSRNDCRKRADYFIIGSLASVGSAILIGLLTRWVIAAWLSNDTLLS
jgi:hypothetical protein